MEDAVIELYEPWVIGGLMRKKKWYATAPINKINDKLRALRIDPQPTIDAVRNLVEQKLKEHHRGHLHLEEILNRTAHLALSVVRTFSFEMTGN